MKVADYERQGELDALRWKVLVAATAVTADVMSARSGLVSTNQDHDDALDAAVCAYAAKLIEPVTCKSCGQVIREDERQQEQNLCEPRHG